MKSIDAEYYGYRDEDDGILEPLEQEHEKKGMQDSKSNMNNHWFTWNKLCRHQSILVTSNVDRSRS